MRKPLCLTYQDIILLVIENSSIIVDGEGHGTDCGNTWVPLQLILHLQDRHLTRERAVTLGNTRGSHTGEPCWLHRRSQLSSHTLANSTLFTGISLTSEICRLTICNAVILPPLLHLPSATSALFSSFYSFTLLPLSFLSPSSPSSGGDQVRYRP